VRAFPSLLPLPGLRPACRLAWQDHWALRSQLLMLPGPSP